ncbi:hypothetical protein BDW59DRAFT_162465 [Aspergillus cavernicola]|uniref:Uncharacterized protein n=1 Tax=Aspergillus cavernicola TaxID=176166 RepID=A0ABR4I9E0_9EURO
MFLSMALHAGLALLLLSPVYAFDPSITQAIDAYLADHPIVTRSASAASSETSSQYWPGLARMARLPQREEESLAGNDKRLAMSTSSDDPTCEGLKDDHASTCDFPLSKNNICIATQLPYCDED